jgi:glycosyltransferase involved in cell wall biosynthesis
MSRPLRICFVAYRGNMRCGGQGVYLWFLARELARLGHRVDVLVGPPYPDAMPFAHSVTRLPDERFWGRWFAGDAAAMLPRPQPLRIFEPLNFYELAASRIGFLPEPFAFSVRALRTLAAQLLAGAAYDVVHDVQCLGWGVLGMRALGLPVVSTVHHPLTVDRRASFARDTSFREALGTATFYPVAMQSLVARRLDRLLTSSRASARQIARDFRVDPARIRMVANGVDTELFAPDPQVRRDSEEILCVARAADPNKGVKTLIEALPQLPRAVRLTLVDEAHTKNPALVRARQLGCADRVRVVGPLSVEELVARYRRAALVAVPSHYEGFGLPAAEAMACGTPVVASASGALPEVLKAGGGGVLVPGHAPEALADGIRRLLERPEQRAELGALGRKGVVAAYSWPRIAERTAALYAEVVGARRGRPTNSTTSASAGTRAPSQFNVQSAARAAPAGSRSSKPDHHGAPQPSETPSTRSSSRLADACSRMRPSS